MKAIKERSCYFAAISLLANHYPYIFLEFRSLECVFTLVLTTENIGITKKYASHVNHERLEKP